MADKKISALTSLAQGDVAASTDVLPIVDTSATETKKITASALVGAGMTAGVTNVDINSGSIDGTTIGANSAAAGTFTNLTASGTVSFSGATVSNGGAVTTIDINGGTIDATSIGASSASTGAFTTLTTSSTVTLNGGTANGVLYLNGSKVATSGSALTFDGSYFTAASGTGTFLADIVQVSGTATKVNANGVGLEFRGGPNPNITSYSRVGSAYLPMTLDTSASIFSISGTEGFRLTSTTLYTASGINVGIGTSSPTYKLDVQSATSVIQNKSTTGTNASYYIANNTGGDFYIGRDNSTGATFGTNTGYTSVLWSAGLYPMTFHTNGIERLRISDTGNLGLGVSPSAWSSGGNITLADNKTIGAAGQYLNLSANWYYSGGEKYVGNGYATLYYQQAGAHKWYIAPNNTSGAGATLAWTTAMTLDASGDLLVGTSSSSGRLTVVTGAGSQAALFQSGSGTTQQSIATFSNVTNSGYLSIAGVGTSSSVGTWTNGSMVIEAVPNSTGNLFIGAYTGDLVFQNGRNNSGRFTSGGDLCVKKTTADATTEGAALQANGRGIFTSNSATECILANRQDSDGTLVDFRQANTTEGSISVSGNTVSYNAFAGSHWSQLQDGSKPDILRGTVMESINELCVWPGENNERLPKSKISDTAGSKKVYGVFMAWDNDWTTTNDMYVTAVGAFICRVNGSVTVQEGDLLESNGDGTARVQADDIIRSSTIGKVTSTVKTHEYDDGSYCVPTVLYCG